MTVLEIAAWLSCAVSVCTLAYTIISNRTKAAYSKVRDIEKTLAFKSDAAVVAAIAGKVDLLEDRATRFETELAHLPDKDTAHKLEVSLAALTGKVDALTERIKPVTAMADRIQEALIERVTMVP
jgi:hypothetical protein